MKDEFTDNTKPVLCDVTLKLILSDCEKRLGELNERDQTSTTLGRVNEIQLMICYLQQKILQNI